MIPLVNCKGALDKTASKPRKKTLQKTQPDVKKELSEALAEQSQERRTRHAETPLPQVGDKVTFTAFKAGLVYEINRVSNDGREVDLHFPGTNLERFRVNPDDLTFVERREPARTSKPAKPRARYELWLSSFVSWASMIQAKAK